MNIAWFGNPFYNDNISNIYLNIKLKNKSYNLPDLEQRTWIDLLFGLETAPLFYSQWISSIF